MPSFATLRVVGEATKGLSDGLKAGHPDIPWKQIAGMRDILIHHYFGVNLDLVWQVVEKHLPEFSSRVEEILAASAPPSPGT
jgi:uncharacterized protein with HEPN domain